MPKGKRKPVERNKCMTCYQIRTILQIRQILGLQTGEDVVAAVQNLKQRVDQATVPESSSKVRIAS